MKKLSFFTAMFALFCGGAAAQGFLLNPERTLFTEVPIGKKVESSSYGINFKIKNRNPAKSVFTFEIKKAKDLERKLMFGYSEIPDVNFVITPKKLEVPANGEAEIPLSFNIPQNDSFYNRKWNAELIVREGQGNIGLEIAADLFIETKGERIEGKIAFTKGDSEEYFFAPATLNFEGFKGEKTALIHNITNEPLTLLLVSESPPEQVVTMFIPLSVGYDRLPDEEWVEPIISGEEKIRRIKHGKEISPQKKITIPPGETAEVRIKIDIPKKKETENKKFESYIFARSPKFDKTRFLRLRIKTER